nr:energy-coupling factor transporter transmembrane protein EcfT [Pyrococcus yayanosii]
MHTMYVEKDSPLHSLDPRVKVISTALLTIIVILTTHPVFSPLMFLTIALGLRILGGIKVGYQLRVLKPLLPLFLLTFAIWPFIIDPWKRGVLVGIGYTFRLASMALLALGLLMTTTQKDLILGLVKLGLPYELGLATTMALRYIPTLYALTQNIMDAQKSRGLELEKGKFLERMRKMAAIVIPLIALTIKTAHELSIAMESRGFGASKKRTFLRDIKMQRNDYLALSLVTILAIIYLYLHLSLGLGSFSP